MTLFLSNRDGSGKTNEEGHYKLPVGALKGNVLTAADLLVTQQSPLALGVRVAAGVFRIPDASANFAYTGWASDFENVGLTAASTSNPRITTIVLYVDKSAPTSASPPNNPNIVKLKAIDGSAATVPVAPTGTQIQTSIGANNPYILLANITVGTNVTSITNANITDLRTRIGVLDDVLQASNLSAIGNLLYPIGSIYTNKTNAANPATLLGFGTWTSLEGRTVVGKAAAGTFAVAGSTGGAETHVLSAAQLPNVSGSVSNPYAGSASIFESPSGSFSTSTFSGKAANFSAIIGGDSSAGSTLNFWNGGSSQPHNNLQPYVVAYMWERIA